MVGRQIQVLGLTVGRWWDGEGVQIKINVGRLYGEGSIGEKFGGYGGIEQGFLIQFRVGGRVKLESFQEEIYLSLELRVELGESFRQREGENGEVGDRQREEDTWFYGFMELGFGCQRG